MKPPESPPPNPPFACSGPHIPVGTCQAAICQATDAPGLNGGNSLSTIGQLLGSVLGKMMSLGSAASTPTTGTTCTSYTPTSDPTQVGVNPCVYYVPGSTCTDPTASNYNQSGSCIYNTCTDPTASNYNDTGTCIYNNLNSAAAVTGATLTASPSSGTAPLSVTFTTSALDSTQTYSLDPGDGSGAQPISGTGACTSTASSSACTYEATYTYQTPGPYTANLSDGSGGALASASVSVTAASANAGFSQVLGDVGNFLAGTTTPSPASSGLPGVFGNILLDQNGATIFASTISSNSETSGFFGSDTVGGQPQGVAGQLCENRPWASNFLASVIPASFFDSLCQWGGYQVGEPAQPAPQVTLTQTTPAQPAPAPVATTTTLAAQAEIWASPSAVPLGARTSIFWNTQGVVSCTETSPDGSFSDDSLSGAASTVPITEATTFTISCLDPNGSPVTDNVTVELSD